MRELSGRYISGVTKITERHASEFNALVAAVDACGEEEVKLNLTDLDATSLWKRDDFVKLATRPNLTLILDPETAAILKSYLLVINATAKYEIREQNIIPDEEDPRIQEKGEEFFKKAYVLKKSGERVYIDSLDTKKIPAGTCVHFNVLDTGLETLSSIGFTGQYVRRAIELITQWAVTRRCRLSVDFTDLIFEGGCDIVLADSLVASRKLKVNVEVIGDDGIAEYVRVGGNVKLSAENKVRFFKQLEPGTVLRLCTYRSTLRSDIAGRKGGGQLAGAILVIFRGVYELDAVYEEIPTQRLYLPEDLEAAGELENTGDVRIPRRRSLAELGIHELCSGSHGHFGPVDATKVYEVSDGNGGLTTLNEIEFAMRGLDYLGIDYNRELLEAGAVRPVKKNPQK